MIYRYEKLVLENLIVILSLLHYLLSMFLTVQTSLNLQKYFKIRISQIGPVIPSFRETNEQQIIYLITDELMDLTLISCTMIVDWSSN